MNKHLLQLILLMMIAFPVQAVLAQSSWKSIRQEERKKEAGKLFKEIQALHTSLQHDQVKEKMEALADRYPEVTSARGYVRMQSAMEFIGKDAGTLTAASWFQGETELNDGDEIKMFVFFESWCPHCQDEMPRIEEVHKKYQEKGLKVVAMTRILQPATRSSIFTFIAERNLTLPVAKVEETLAEQLGVDGVPWASIIKKGKIVWSGNPELVKDETLTAIMAD